MKQDRSQTSSSKYIQLKDNRQTSPSKVRIDQIGEKLNNIESHIHQNKQLQKETFETKIKVLDQRIAKNAELDENKFKQMKENLIQIQEGIQNEKQNYQDLQENQLNDLRIVEKFLIEEINKLKLQNKHSDISMNKQMEEKYYTIKQDLSREKQDREQRQDDSTLEIGEEINNIQTRIDFERKQREQGTEKLITKLSNDVINLQEMLNKEKQIREESQTRIFKMLGDIDDNLNYQISVEKKQRESLEETFLSLLEQSFSKIEASFTYKSLS